MAASRLCKLVPRRLSSSSTKVVHRGYAAAAQALVNYDYWEHSLPALQDADGHRVGSSPRWVFLGSPGLGKRAYASRLAKLLEVPHISMGDLLRKEMGRPTFIAKQIAYLVNQGKLVSDDVIFNLLSRTLDQGAEMGESGFVLDGFPRTATQAITLDETVDIDLVVSMRSREDVLETTCLGRRVCSECGRDFNVAHIDVESCPGGPRIVMAPLPPPASCLSKMTMRADDTEVVVKEKLRIYSEQSKLVEEYYRRQGKILDFEVLGGIPQTWPRLLAALQLGDKDSSQHQLAA